MNLAQRLLDDPRLATLFAALAKTGGETRVVGGAVRDALFGLPPHEIDLATTALPEDVLAAARDAGLKGVPTGIEHGTVTIVVAGTPFEVTTLREDVETDGRFAKVRFGGDFDQDARRRDFTVNALSLTPDGELHDPTGGIADLEARRIRFIGDAATRIREDYLRVLRFFRFNASHGEGAFDREGLHESIIARENLARLSRERVRAELVKLLPARRAPEVMRAMSQAGVIEVILGMGYPARLERLAAFEAAQGKKPDAVLRLAAFAVLTVEDAERLRDRLRLSNDEWSRLSSAARTLAALHGIERPPPVSHLREMLFICGARAAADALALAFAESAAAPDDPQWLEAAKYLDETPAPAFPIRGADLIARGVAPGRELGAVLKSLQAQWIRAGFPRDPQAVMQLLEEAVGIKE
ncbi:CCA tRNA nucleotidyltransferase [Methylocystis sp. WRRC1]|uniref:CCA tRNA nucleotidyltransferase n=1 Tax=Methylocystis sp. WRRC1 TaxID=1732014 RepID=UPI001D142BC8|nr:CCA tRNA nucleotidyltransferase [Methylocystis sp. WRRC1]MCC3244050.1 CCA tRNA nucleotidyltransferase [Methylocystis sp. WRRC1]